MAYANWLSLSPTSGNGNETVNASALSSNTGRNARQTTVTFKAAGITDITRVVAQSGKPEFSSIQATAAANQSGGTVTLAGTSNSSKLTFSKSNDNIGLTLPSTYTANGVSTNNGAAISGDPGATSEYSFSIALTVPANSTVAPKTCQIIVTDDSGDDHTCTLTLAAGAATLTVSQVSGNIPWDASSSVTFDVTSNTNWSIE